MSAPRLSDGARFWYFNLGFSFWPIPEIFRLDDEVIFPVNV